MLRSSGYRLSLPVLALSMAMANAQQPRSLHLNNRIDLENVDGRIDHFSADVRGERLFMSALGNHSVEVIDAHAAKRLKTMAGLAEPQGVLYDPNSNHIVVACAEDGSVNVFDGTSYERLNTAKPGADSDNVRYSPRSKQFIVGYSDGLALFDPAGKQTGNIPLDGHAESFQLEKHGTRAFVNVPTQHEIEVIELAKNSVVARWPFKNEKRNYPMALDEGHHRLFVGFRDPAKLLVIDTENGQVVASVDIVGDTDDLFYDAAKHRICVIGGEGFVDIIDQKDPDHYERAERIRTAPGARTGYFVLEWNKLFVAVPHRDAQRAEILVFEAK